MNRTMVVATFKPGTNMQEVFAVVREEVAQVERLRAQQRMGTVPTGVRRSTVCHELLSRGRALSLVPIEFGPELAASTSPARALTSS